jgi:hypothetical protein
MRELCQRLPWSLVLEGESTRIRAELADTPLRPFLSQARRFAFPVNLVPFIVRKAVFGTSLSGVNCAGLP